MTGPSTADRTRAVPLAQVLLCAFAVVSAADLVALLVGSGTGHTVAKPLLMPLLAGYVAVRGGPRLLIAALLFGWGGDVLLLSHADPAFLAGMGSFAVGHVCYLVLFKSREPVTGPLLRSPGAGLTRAQALVLPYGAALVGSVALLWPDLPAGLRIPVAGYSLLLTAMAYGSTRLGLVAGAGGALFLLSDSLIATGVAHWPQLPRPDFWIMLTYLAAQYLLARGALGTLGARGRTERAYG
ncbi:lysoplasmalogenase [Streptomyces sp. NPDC002004]